MPMLEDYEDEEEQLYLLEVVVDKVGVCEEKAAVGQDPVLPAMVRIRFGDFPVMEVDRNQLLLVEGKDSKDTGWKKAGELKLSGLPKEWPVRETQEEYEVALTYMDRQTGEEGCLEVRLPKAVVGVGEGLRYLLAVAKARLAPDTFQGVQDQVEYQLSREREAGRRYTLHSFSAGKSCLFHMTPSELIRSIAEYPVRIQLFRSSSEGNEFVHTLIGETKVSLGMSFTKSILVACTPGALHPTTAHLESTFPMYDNFDFEVGDMHLFVRLSCFGRVPFQDEEGDEVKKQRFLKGLIKKEMLPKPAERLDMKYPWKKNLSIVPDRPAPLPRFQPLFEEEELPPPPLPEFDMGDFLPGLPRCTPTTPPPCYRRSGDMPLPRCNKKMEEQLRREENSKGLQTEPPRSEGEVKGEQEEQPRPEEQVPPSTPACTCQPLPPELCPTDQGLPNIQCTCATIMQRIVTGQAPPISAPPTPNAKKQPAFQQQEPLGDSDYEITLTKAECGLENQENYDERTLPDKTPKSPKKGEQSSKTETDLPIHKEKDKETNKEPTKPKPNTESTERFDPESSFPFEAGSPIRLPSILDSKDDMEYKKKIVARSLYEATPGMYPGRQYGHRRCVTRIQPVPKHMGWLWSAVTFEGLLKRRGWYPGSIRKEVNSLMTKMKEDVMEGPSGGGGGGKFTGKWRPKGRPPSKAAETVKYNPNLHIHKKEGFYYITMIPVRTDSQEEAGEEPAPIEYKIDPKHPDGLDPNESYEESSSSSSSNVKSYEMNFIVPLAMRARKKKVPKAVAGVQYNEADFIKKGAKKPVKAAEPVEEKKVKKGGGKKGKGKKK